MPASSMWLRLRLTCRLIGFRFVAIVAAPLRWNERRINSKRQYQLDLIRAAGEAPAKTLETLGSSLVQVVDKLAQAQTEQSKVLQVWLEGFKVTTPPKTTASTDRDEYSAELSQRLDAQGVDKASPLAVMEWLERAGIDQEFE